MACSRNIDRKKPPKNKTHTHREHSFWFEDSGHSADTRSLEILNNTVRFPR